MADFRVVATGFLAVSLVSGCVKEEDWTRSDFGAGPSLGNLQTGTVSSPLGTVAMRSGTDEAGAAAFASLTPSSGSVSTPTSGSATFSGTWDAIGVRNIRVDEDAGLLFGNNFSTGGTVNLSASFGNGTLSGNGTSIAGDTLSVNGTFGSGSSNLNGSVTFNGVRGELDGILSADEALGAFHGNNDTTVFSGGFEASAPISVE